MQFSIAVVGRGVQTAALMTGTIKRSVYFVCIYTLGTEETVYSFLINQFLNYLHVFYHLIKNFKLTHFKKFFLYCLDAIYYFSSIL